MFKVFGILLFITGEPVTILDTGLRFEALKECLKAKQIHKLNLIAEKAPELDEMFWDRAVCVPLAEKGPKLIGH